MDDLALAAFLCCIALVFYSYVLYPLTLIFVRQPKAPENAFSDSKLPSVTVLIAAHDEEAVIADRIANVLSSDYPAGKLSVLVVSDGSVDSTDSIVESFTDDRVKLLSHQPNKGKSYSLNRALPEADGEITVMTDANTAFESSAIRQLVYRLLADDRPSAVCGKLILHDPITGNNVDGLYWRYESWIKSKEGALGAALGANGGIYAFWRHTYHPIPHETILDDLTIPLLIRANHSGPVVFEESAIAHEDSPQHLGDEFERRVRIGAGAFQSLKLLYPLLSPKYGMTAVAFFSHKVLRWLTPHLMIVCLLLAISNFDRTVFQSFLFLAFVIVLMSWVGRNMSGDSLCAKIFRLISQFMALNLALGFGFIRWATSPQSGTWKRTARSS